MENENKENMIENNNPLTIPVEVEQIKNSQENENDKKKKFNKKYLFIILWIVIILLVGIVLCFTVFKDDKTPSNVYKDTNNILITDSIVIGTQDKLNIGDILSTLYQYKNMKNFHIETDNSNLVTIDGLTLITNENEGMFHIVIKGENKKQELQVTVMKMVNSIFDSLDKQKSINYTNHVVETETRREDNNQITTDYTIFYNHEKGANIELYSDCSFVSRGDIDDFYNYETKEVNFDELYKRDGDDTASINISNLFRNNIRLVELKDNIYIIKLIDDSLVKDGMGDVFSSISNTEYYLTFENNALKKLDMKVEYNKGYYKEYYQSNEFTFYENKEPEELNHMKMCANNFKDFVTTTLEDNFKLQLNDKNIDIKVKYNFGIGGGPSIWGQTNTVYFNDKQVREEYFPIYMESMEAEEKYLDNYYRPTLKNLETRFTSDNFKKIIISNIEYLVYTIETDYPGDDSPHKLVIIDDSGKEIKNLSFANSLKDNGKYKKDNNGCYILGYDCKEPTFIKYNEDSIQYIEISYQNDEYSVLEKKLTIDNGIVNETVIKKYKFEDVLEYYDF